jgi:hypothetical protein
MSFFSLGNLRIIAGVLIALATDNGRGRLVEWVESAGVNFHFCSIFTHKRSDVDILGDQSWLLKK